MVSIQAEEQQLSQFRITKSDKITLDYVWSTEKYVADTRSSTLLLEFDKTLLM